MKDAGLNEHDKVGNFGKSRDVDSQHFHSELPVTVPHGDGEHSLVVLLVDGQLLMRAWENKIKNRDNYSK